MQHEDTSGNEQSAPAETSYKQLLGQTPFIDKLTNQTPSSLDTRVIPELMAGKNVLAYTRQAFSDLSSVLLPFAALSSTTSKAVVIAPSLAEADRVFHFMNELGIESFLESEEETSTSKVDAAKVIIGTPESLLLLVQEKSISAERIAIIGFESSLPVIPSDELNSIMQELAKSGPHNVCWMSKAVPLVLTGFIKMYVRENSNECVEINLASENEFQVEHLYYELPRDLLAKPNALCDLLESFDRPKTLIYCNAPSDADLVDALLNRKGIPSKKLIGHIPDRAVHAAFDQVQAGELTALVVTDISARSIPVEQFDVIFHYSTPDDPEVYIHRVGHPTEDTRLRKVISLIGSTDLGDFHYLKKIVEFDFIKANLPSGEQLSELQIKRLLTEAQKFAAQSDDQEITTIAKQLSELKSAEQQTVIAYLLHNTLNALPAALSSSRKESHRPVERDRREDRGDRDERGGRGDREDTRRGRGSSRDRDNYRSRDDDNRNDRGRDRDSNRGRGRGEDSREDRPPREQLPPPKRDVRLYIGHGKEQGLTEEKITELLTKAGLNAEHKPQRIILRSCYAFVDFPEEGEKEILSTLENKDFSDSEKMVVIKAARITQPREDQPREESPKDSDRVEDEQVEQASA